MSISRLFKCLWFTILIFLPVVYSADNKMPVKETKQKIQESTKNAVIELEKIDTAVTVLGQSSPQASTLQGKA